MPKENQMVRCPVCQCLIPQRAYEAHIAPVSDELVSSGIKPVDEVLGEQHEQWCKDNHIEPASQPDTGHPYDQSDLDDSQPAVKIDLPLIEKPLYLNFYTESVVTKYGVKQIAQRDADQKIVDALQARLEKAEEYKAILGALRNEINLKSAFDSGVAKLKLQQGRGTKQEGE